jgi:hypothetical protein
MPEAPRNELRISVTVSGFIIGLSRRNPNPRVKLVERSAMFENGKFPADYVWNAKESFELQLEALGAEPMTPLQEKYFLRNLVISLELHFASRDQVLEVEGGALQELRDAAILMLHDAKTPVARAYFDELFEGVFNELVTGFLA